MNLPKISVLRLGHRPARDKRVSMHTALVARAFGADGIYFSDIIDKELKTNIEDVVERFGGPFFVEMGELWSNIIKKWQSEGGEVVHLTMYGLPLPSVIEEIKSSPKDKLVVIGAEKVPGEIYKMATFNVSITNQPHSEIAALCIFLDRFFDGKTVNEYNRQFSGAKLKIVPCARGKQVVKCNL